MAKLTYEDFKSRISIQEILIDAGYKLNRRDGLRYPSYVRTDDKGNRVRGDKFIVTRNGLCCFQPPVQRNYNVISFIKEHPEMFADYQPGMDKDRLVNLVCNRLLNNPIDDREKMVVTLSHDLPTFNIKDYKIYQFSSEDKETHKPFYPYFKSRGINLGTQNAFRKSFYLAEHVSPSGQTFKNLSFPMFIPGSTDNKIVGFEERGRRRLDGTSYKGIAKGSNASEGLWIASPDSTKLSESKHVYWFESGYDAMAYYQIKSKEDKELSKAIFVSTGGTPTYMQLEGVIKNSPNAVHHLCFDNDLAGRQFVANFECIADQVKPTSEAVRKYLAIPGSPEDNDKKSEAFNYLPKDIQKQYFKTWNLVEELYSGYFCNQDRLSLKKQIDEGWKDFHSMLDNSMVKSKREIPLDGYKDWNDQLLDKKQVVSTEDKETASYNEGNNIIKEADQQEDNHYHSHR